MTESVVALPHGSAVGGVENPRASARARVKQSVTHRDRVRRAAATQPVAVARRISRVMYRDAADSWIVRDSTPSIAQVWATDYAALATVDYAPFRVWCRFYRFPAVLFAAGLDSAKWMLIHPVRGPLFLTAVSVGVAVATH